jgi:hypothetical protein
MSTPRRLFAGPILCYSLISLAYFSQAAYLYEKLPAEVELVLLQNQVYNSFVKE